MSYVKKDMSYSDALDISAWEYPAPYHIYSFRGNAGVVKELLGGGHYSVYEKEELVGYYCTGEPAQVPCPDSAGLYKNNGFLDIGIGLKPALTGKGRGRKFFEFVLKCIRETHLKTGFRLTVAAFNERAIKVYENCGFIKTAEFTRRDTGVKFIIMQKPDRPAE